MQLLLGDAEHFGSVASCGGYATRWDLGAVCAGFYAMIFIAYTPVAKGSGHIRDLEPCWHL